MKYLIGFALSIVASVYAAPSSRFQNDVVMSQSLTVRDVVVSQGLTSGSLNVTGAGTLRNVTITQDGTVGDWNVTNSSLIGSSSTPADLKSVLELRSTTKGFLPPRMTGTQRDAISSPPNGLVVYNTDTNKVNYYNGSVWGEVSGGGGGLFQESQNLLSNSSWEADTSSWTASGGTYTRVTAAANIVPPGIGAASWDPSAGDETLTSNTVTITSGDGLAGRNGVFTCAVKTTATDLKMEVLEYTSLITPGSTTATVTPSSTGFTRNSVNFVFPAGSSTVTARFKSQSDSAIAYIDQCYWGLAEGYNVSQVSQAGFYGGVIWPGVASCSWSRTSNTYGSFSADSDCTFPSGSGLLGAGSAPSTKIPAVTFSNMPPGKYLFIATGSFFKSDTTNAPCHYRFYDGTTGGQGNPVYDDSSVVAVPMISGYFDYTSAATRTIEIQAANSGSGSCNIENNNIGLTDLVITAYRFPTTAEQTYRADQSPASWSGSLAGTGGGWSTTSASYADPSVATTSTTLTELQNRNFGSVTAESTKLPGITFTPNKTGMYKVCAAITAANSNDTVHTYARLVDGSGAVITPGQGGASSGAAGGIPITLCGTKNFSSNSATTVKVQLAASANTASIVQSALAPIGWSIFDLDSSVSMPFLVGGVVTGSSGVERIERARVTSGTCTSSPCTITATSGVSSATRSTQGNYEINFVAGTFSATPTCTCISTNPGTADHVCIGPHAVSGGPSATVFSFGTRVPNTGAAADSQFMVNCIGPK